MAARSRRLFLGCLLGVLSAWGCGDPKVLTYFLLPETKDPPKLRALTSEDPKKTSRVVILTYMPLETRFELVQADRQLSELLARQLKKQYEEDQVKVEIVPPRKVEEYKNAHPTWKERDLAEVGRDFHADYVVYLEVASLSLYERGSANMVYRGRASISVSVVDVSKPDETPEHKDYTCLYPSETRGGIDWGLDTNEVQFREKFLDYVARELSWYFLPSSTRDHYRYD